METQQPKLWITTKPSFRGPNRRRAGIDFSRGVTREVIIIEATDDEIAERVKRGEAVANINGARLLAGDDALIVSDIPPPPPPPSLAMILGGPPPEPIAPAHWVEVAGDLKLSIPTTIGAAEPVLVTALERWSSMAADPRTIPVRRAFVAFLMGATLLAGEVLRRLRYAIADDLPLRSAGSFGAVPWSTPLAPVARHRPAANESLPTWMQTLAKVIGVPMPTMLVDTSHGDADQLYRQHSEATRAALYEPTNVETIDATLETGLAVIREAQRLGFVAWSDGLDVVRRMLLASIDDARATAAADTPSIALFALDELARYGRGLPVTGVLSADSALAIVMGVVPLRQIAIAPDTDTVRLMVSTKPGIKRRRRAGEDFGTTPRIVDLHPDQAAEIERDDGLLARRVDPNWETAEELRAKASTLPALLAEREELERQLAEQRAQIEAAEQRVGIEATEQASAHAKRIAELEKEVAEAEADASKRATGKPKGPRT